MIKGERSFSINWIDGTLSQSRERESLCNGKNCKRSKRASLTLMNPTILVKKSLVPILKINKNVRKGQIER